MSRLDFEFEQVLGSWLDHCSESLSILTPPESSSSSSSSSSTTLDLLQRNFQTGMLLEGIFHDDENNKNDDDKNGDDTTTVHANNDIFWYETSKETIEKFKSIIPDNMEKIREIFRVLLIRLRDTNASAEVVTAVLRSRGGGGADDEDQDEKDETKQASDVMLFLPKRFSGVSNSASSSSNSSSISKKMTSSSNKKTFSLLPISAPIARHVRRRLFFWMLFDALLQTFPLVVCQWCMQTRDFPFLVEHSLPWEYACNWCDRIVSDKWVPLFQNFSSSSTTSSTTFAGRLESIARQRRTTVIVAQNLAVEQVQKQKQEEEEAAVRDASRHELNELYELTQRLIGALNRHKPSDGRLAIVKLENNNNQDNDNNTNDPFRVKQEMQMQMQAAALHFRDVGNTKDEAFDVDDEYEPNYVQGAEMGTLAKLQQEQQQQQAQQAQQQQQQQQGASDAAAGTSGTTATTGGRRAPRVRPR